MEVEYFTLHPKTEKISDFQSLHTESEMFACVFPGGFIYPILSNQNACNGCKNTEDLT